MSNSDLDLLEIFRRHPFTKDISFGVVDVHSHKLESHEAVRRRVESALTILPKEKVWIDPDCASKLERSRKPSRSFVFAWKLRIPSVPEMLLPFLYFPQIDFGLGSRPRYDQLTCPATSSRSHLKTILGPSPKPQLSRTNTQLFLPSTQFKITIRVCGVTLPQCRPGWHLPSPLVQPSPPPSFIFSTCEPH